MCFVIVGETFEQQVQIVKDYLKTTNTTLAVLAAKCRISDLRNIIYKQRKPKSQGNWMEVIKYCKANTRSGNK
jgi:hypothetical protein